MFCIIFTVNLNEFSTEYKYLVKFDVDMVYLRFDFHSKIQFLKTLK